MNKRKFDEGLDSDEELVPNRPSLLERKRKEHESKKIKLDYSSIELLPRMLIQTWISKLQLENNSNASSLNIKWSTKAKRAAGLYYVDKNEIRLSKFLLTTVERVKNVLAHEFCHFLVKKVDQNHKAQPHGEEFRQWGAKMKSIDPEITVNTCHAYTYIDGIANLKTHNLYVCTLCGGHSPRKEVKVGRCKKKVAGNRICGGELKIEIVGDKPRENE